MMTMRVSRDLRTKVHQIRGISANWLHPNTAKFHHTRPNDVREKRYKNFRPFSILAPDGDPLGQTSPISALMDSKARTNNVPNFVLFYEITEIKLT